jgi:LITAF-like zinc ribbon domain
MNLNLNIKLSGPSTPIHSHDLNEMGIFKSINFQNAKDYSNQHSRKTSQGSAKSQTCASTNSTSTSRSVKIDYKASETKLDTKVDTEFKTFEAKSQDQFEFSTQNQTPRLIWCAFCKGEHITYNVYKNNSQTFFNSAVILLMGGVLGCCLIPYATNSCKDQKTVCSKCAHIIDEQFE